MFNILEFLRNLKKEEIDYSKLSESERRKLLRSKIKKVNPKVIQYLLDKFSNLHIEVMGDTEGDLFELMSKGDLMGWCWETTESAIVFLNDDDYIERGNLYFDERTPEYYHSWICFHYNGEEYVLDPCLSILCKKSFYSGILITDVKARITAKDVKEELIRVITTHNNDDKFDKSNMYSIFKMMMSDEDYNAMVERRKDEVELDWNDNIDSPLYRNSSGYKAEISDNKIKKLTVHYYDPEG